MKVLIKVLLPAWSLPDDHVLKKIFSTPSGPAHASAFGAKNAEDDLDISEPEENHQTT